MSDLIVELCPETGICSILQQTAGKFDLMPNEVQNLRDAGDDPEKIREVLAEVDPAAAAKLSVDELTAIAARLAR